MQSPNHTARHLRDLVASSAHWQCQQSPSPAPGGTPDGAFAIPRWMSSRRPPTGFHSLNPAHHCAKLPVISDSQDNRLEPRLVGQSVGMVLARVFRLKCLPHLALRESVIPFSSPFPFSLLFATDSISADDSLFNLLCFVIPKPNLSRLSCHVVDN